MSDHALVSIIDDEVSIRDSLTLLLETVKLSAESYDSAEAFLQNVDLAKPRCIVTDLRLPGIDGLEC